MRRIMSTNAKDLAGRVCLVTGANTGIGEVTARELARRGAHVFLACRSEKKTVPVVAAIRANTGNDRVEFIALDLGNMDAIRRSAADFLGRGLPLHLLVNNAGIAGQRGITSDGFELAFGVNHLGHFLLTTLLLDKLRESAPARVVTVSSQSHYRAKTIDLDAVQQTTASLTGMPEYSVSKLANVLFSAELASRLAGTQVTTYSLHPGMIASDIWRPVFWPLRSVIKLFMTSPEDGAMTSLYCATLPQVAEQTGLYYDNCRQKPPSAAGQSATFAQELWQKSEAWSAK